MSEQCRYCGRISADVVSRTHTPKLLECNDFQDCRRFLAERVESLTAERDALKLRLLSAAGDDLCRLSQEEIKAYTSGEVQIPPREEFIASCERFHAQLAAGPGVLKDCLTLAQLIAENQKLEAERNLARFEFNRMLYEKNLSRDAALKAEAERDAAIKRAETAEAIKLAFEETPKQWSTARAPTIEAVMATARQIKDAASAERHGKLLEQVESLTRERDLATVNFGFDICMAFKRDMEVAIAERDAAIKRATEAETALALSQGGAFCCECGGTAKQADRRGKLLERWLAMRKGLSVIGIPMEGSADLVRETEEELRR